MGYGCTIEISTISPSSVRSALEHEQAYERSTSRISVRSGKLFIKISAKDIASLRASFNDYMRLARVCEIERCFYGK